VSVRHSLQRDGIIGPPKNESSVRQLPLSSSVVASLNKRREIQEVEHQGAAEYWQGYGDDLDFSTQVGTPTNDRNLARTFLLLCSKAKVGVWVPYELRHTFATLALEAGMPIQKVSKVLGHSDIRETAGTYAHVTPRHLRDVVEAMDAVLA
jgi:integrase